MYKQSAVLIIMFSLVSQTHITRSDDHIKEVAIMSIIKFLPSIFNTSDNINYISTKLASTISCITLLLNIYTMNIIYIYIYIYIERERERER